MMPDAELSEVRERKAEEASVVGGTGERQRLVLSLRIDDGIYVVAEGACSRIKVDATKIIVDGVELQATLWQGTSCTEIE